MGRAGGAPVGSAGPPAEPPLPPNPYFILLPPSFPSLQPQPRKHAGGGRGEGELQCLRLFPATQLYFIYNKHVFYYPLGQHNEFLLGCPVTLK